MATISKAIAENTVRTATFTALNIADHPEFVRISNKAYGALFTDDNGVERMVEVRAIVRAVKTMEEKGMSASELLAAEAQKYQDDLAEAEEKRVKKEAEKAKKKKEKEEK